MIIVDARTFTTTTFSNYKTTAVRKELVNVLLKGDIEASSYWTAELVSSGHFEELWDVLFLFYAKYIHVANVKIANYMELRFGTFRGIMAQLAVDLNARNSPEIRRLFAEIVYVLCFSPRKASLELSKTPTHFDLAAAKLKAPAVSYAEFIFRKGDAKEIYIPFNEFAYALHVKNYVDACQWLEWVLGYDALCAKNKTPLKYVDRAYCKQSKRDVVWLVWDLLLTHDNVFLKNVLSALVALFCVRYSPSCKTRRRHLIYFAVLLHCEPVNAGVDLVQDKAALANSCSKVDLVYKRMVEKFKAQESKGPPKAQKS
jgi:hypothetical protein